MKLTTNTVCLIATIAAVFAATVAFRWMILHTDLTEADALGTMIVIYFAVLSRIMFAWDKLQKERRKRK